MNIGDISNSSNSYSRSSRRVNPPVGGGFVLSFDNGYRLARQAVFERNLQTLDKAISGNDWSGAQRSLRTLTTNNPQYSQDAPTGVFGGITSKFQELGRQLEAENTPRTKEVWKDLKKDLQDKGIVPGGGNITAAKARAAVSAASQESFLRLGLRSYGNEIVYGSTGIIVNPSNYTPGSFLDVQV